MAAINKSARQPIIAGNWKMNGSMPSVTQLLTDLLTGDYQGTAELVVFPAFVYLPLAQAKLKHSNIHYGAQDISQHVHGAYTGEVSGQMLLDFGCQYVLIGHCERRAYFAESDELIANKCVAAVAVGLWPIVCIGETLAEREQGQTEAVIQRQLRLLLALDRAILQHIIIAYEPVWAIGSGLSATPTQAQQVHAFIRQQVHKHDENIANSLRILYGGSLKPDNANELFTLPDIDGGLIGGASLQAQSFLDIANSWPN